MVKYFCDRCKNEIVEENQWEILVQEKPDNNGFHSSLGVTINLCNNITNRKIYCKNCAIEVLKLLNKL